jgi:hypothetical protein
MCNILETSYFTCLQYVWASGQAAAAPQLSVHLWQYSTADNCVITACSAVGCKRSISSGICKNTIILVFGCSLLVCHLL